MSVIIWRKIIKRWVLDKSVNFRSLFLFLINFIVVLVVFTLLFMTF